MKDDPSPPMITSLRKLSAFHSKAKSVYCFFLKLPNWVIVSAALGGGFESLQYILPPAVYWVGDALTHYIISSSCTGQRENLV